MNWKKIKRTENFTCSLLIFPPVPSKFYTSHSSSLMAPKIYVPFAGIKRRIESPSHRSEVNMTN